MIQNVKILNNGEATESQVLPAHVTKLAIPLFKTSFKEPESYMPSMGKMSLHMNHAKMASEIMFGDADLVYDTEANQVAYFIDEDGEPRKISGADAYLILRYMATPSQDGYCDPLIDLNFELVRVNHCNEYYNELQGEMTGSKYFKLLDCEKWWCRHCGDTRDGNYRLIQGVVHKKRKKAVYAKLTSGQFIHNKEDLVNIINKVCITQFVFTVPKAYRHLFKSQKGLNNLCDTVRKIMRDEYPGEGMIAYVHVVGDLYRWEDEESVPEGAEILRRNAKGEVLRLATPDEAGFNPHVNVHVFTERYDTDGNEFTHFVPKTKVMRIKDEYREGLIKRGVKFDNPNEVNVNVLFEYDSLKKKLHKIKYMTKPIEADFLPFWYKNNNTEMIDFTCRELKNFRFIRYWEGLSNAKYKEWYTKMTNTTIITELVTEEEQIAGEPLKKVGIVVKGFVDRMKKREDIIVEELAPGFFRVQVKEKSI